MLLIRLELEKIYVGIRRGNPALLDIVLSRLNLDGGKLERQEVYELGKNLLVRDEHLEIAIDLFRAVNAQACHHSRARAGDKLLRVGKRKQLGSRLVHGLIHGLKKHSGRGSSNVEARI